MLAIISSSKLPERETTRTSTTVVNLNVPSIPWHSCLSRKSVKLSSQLAYRAIVSKCDSSDQFSSPSTLSLCRLSTRCGFRESETHFLWKYDLLKNMLEDVQVQAKKWEQHLLHSNNNNKNTDTNKITSLNNSNKISNSYSIGRLHEDPPEQRTCTFIQEYDATRILPLSEQGKNSSHSSSQLAPTFTFDREISVQIKSAYVTQVQKALKNILYLYLNGDYRGMNESSYLKCVLDSNTDHTEEDGERASSPHKSSSKLATNSRYVSYKYKSKHINFDCSGGSKYPLVKNEAQANNEVRLIGEKDDTSMMMTGAAITEANQSASNKKQVIYNKSKYMMQFMMRLLEPDHLSLVEMPLGLERRIKEITRMTKESSKHNKLSQSLFYNHSHFDCLFLQIRPQNIDYIRADAELCRMHEAIFGLKDLADPFEVCTTNMYKHVLALAVLAQVSIIRKEIIPIIPTHSLSFKSMSKLKYFERICDSISKLNAGTIITKF